MNAIQELSNKATGLSKFLYNLWFWIVTLCTLILGVVGIFGGIFLQCLAMLAFVWGLCFTTLLTPALTLFQGKQIKSKRTAQSGKSYGLTLFLCLFFGPFGFHRFYSGHFFTGFLYPVTAGGFFLGWITDLITILRECFVDGDGKPIRRKASASPKATTPPQAKPKSSPNPQPKAKPTPKTTGKPAPSTPSGSDGFSDIHLSGTEEKKETIPPQRPEGKTESSTKQSPPEQKASTPQSKDPIRTTSRAQQDTMQTLMERYANKIGHRVPYVPLNNLHAGYTDLTTDQKAWYFYWRTEVRNGSYPDTDLPYILLHIYELLWGIGWDHPAVGRDTLLRLWQRYREQHPQLDSLMCNWIFDFTRTYNLTYEIPEESTVRLPSQIPPVNILIDCHRQDKPLKLSYELITALSDYSMEQSSFYKSGHQSLIREAVPRVVALADAALLKKSKHGILSTYAPHRATVQRYTTFTGSLCPDANRTVSVSVIGYYSSQKLRSYITELVRFTENTLRAIFGHRGRLRGITVDADTAALVEAFLKKEYAPEKESEKPGSSSISLNFDSIEALRRQSDAVRDALEVEQAEEVSLSQLEEIRAIFDELSAYGRELMDLLHDHNWEYRMLAGNQRAFSELNTLSQRYLARQILVMEGNTVIVEDDFRDELAEIYRTLPPKQDLPLTPSDTDTKEETNSYFDSSLLSEPMNSVLECLSPSHGKALYLIAALDNPLPELEALAEENLTMPEMILDEINDMALQFLDDILIDTFDETPGICEQYAEELKHALK